MKVNIIISFILLLIIYLFLKCKESFHSNIEKTNENKIDTPIHNFSNNDNDNDNYMIVGDDIQANIANNFVNENKINICNECKMQKCDSLECDECNSYCSFTKNEHTITTMSNMDPENEPTITTMNLENEPTMSNMNLENEPTMSNMDPDNEPEAKYAIIPIKDFFRD